MNRFYEDSSQAKTLSKDKDIKKAVRNFSKKPMQHYELREYDKHGNYNVVDVFLNREGAKVAKEFATLQFGAQYAIVAVHPYCARDYLSYGRG